MHYFYSKQKIGERGQTVIIAIILFSFGSFIFIGGIMSQVYADSKEINNFARSVQTYYLAESGIEDVVYRIVTGKTTVSPETLALNGATTTVNIVTTSSTGREITAEGDITSYIRRIKTELTTSVTGVSFFYGAQVGEGGLEMDQGSKIQGVGGAVGNVYSNGPIQGATGATITGDAIVATGVTEDTGAQSLVCNTDEIVGQANPQIDYAQSFIPSTTTTLAKVSLYIKKVGSPSSPKLKIVADNGGSPDDTEIEEGTLDKNLVGTSYGWIDVTFPNPPTLTSGTTYWMVLDAVRNSSKYWIWCSDSGAGYTNGAAKYSEDWDDDPWTLIPEDLAFKTYFGEGVSSIEDVKVEGTAKANLIKDSIVEGDAYYQTILNTTVTGTEYPGSSDPPVLNLPVSDANIAQWKVDAANGGTIVGDCGDSGDPSCVIDEDDTLSLGSKKIDGNLNLSGKQTLNVTGSIHITGNVDIDGNNTIVKCDASFGSDSCIIVVDGWIHVKNNTIFSGSGDPDSFLMILTTLPGCNGNSGVGCTDHDGAIDIHNNAGGAIFYASESMINLHNGVNITSAVGYKLRLDNNAIISYEIGITNASFSSGPSGGWSVDTWVEVE